MQMEATFQIPIELLLKVVKTMKEANCLRKQPVFELYPGGYWKHHFVCGRNEGKYHNGFGVGHICSKECPLRVPMEEE